MTPPPIDDVVAIFRDGAVCAGHLALLGEAEAHDRVQDELLIAANALLTRLEGGQQVVHGFLQDSHPWIRHYAAIALLRHRVHTDAARAALVSLVSARGPVATKSEIALAALHSGTTH
jgi:hypothetical protein